MKLYAAESARYEFALYAKNLAEAKARLNKVTMPFNLSDQSTNRFLKAELRRLNNNKALYRRELTDDAEWTIWEGK